LNGQKQSKIEEVAVFLLFNNLAQFNENRGGESVAVSSDPVGLEPNQHTYRKVLIRR